MAIAASGWYRRRYVGLGPGIRIKLVVVAKKYISVLTGKIAAGRQHFGGRAKIFVDPADLDAVGNLRQLAVIVGKTAVLAWNIKDDAVGLDGLSQQAVKRWSQLVESRRDRG